MLATYAFLQYERFERYAFVVKILKDFEKQYRINYCHNYEEIFTFEL